MREILADNYKKIEERVYHACERCGRNPDDITVVWVSKTKPRDLIESAWEAGARVFGENRAQEVVEKFPLPGQKSCELHFIGRLQSNKVRQVLPVCQCIESVDSVRLLKRIDTICGEIQFKRDVFLQVNTSGEDTKAGFSPESLLEKMPEIASSSQQLCIKGLMTIGPFVDVSTGDGERVVRKSFRDLALLLKEIKSRYSDKTGVLSPEGQFLRQFHSLSMGMSSDFELAIEEGSHYIRIGTNLFGTRMR
ncbi:MAG: YggS family pyridoxal phosphate-dependent enzyme [Fibrobacteria bacterium]|nr:YggS family pyridoxal phosphate-dependent enzyme [Fibrobacteria bacterium]